MSKNSDEPCLLAERAERELHVFLNRCTYANALDLELVERLCEVLDEVERAGLGLMTIQGRGTHFCSGFDLSDIDSLSDADLLLRFVRIETLLQRLHHAPFLTVAAMHGHAIGAGADLFCSCEVRIATEQARFRMPGWRFGVALGTRRLTSRVGGAAARSLLSSAALLDAKTALEIGLVTRIAPRSEWPTIIAEEFRKRSQLHPDAYANLVRTTLSDTREADMASLVRTASRPGLRDRIRSYLQAERMS